VIQVFELRETPEPAIIMAYCALGNIVDAGTVDDDEHVTAWGQILEGLIHLHTKGIVHRDLKPENILIEKNPLFKVIIADFGMAKVANDTTLLQTFCGSLKYAAPEVFPGRSSGHGPPVDIWSLGVIVLEWIYGSLTTPNLPISEKENEEVSDQNWYNWLDTWVASLLDRMEDQEEEDRVIQILAHMIECKVTTRWFAIRCLAQGFKSRVFKRSVADGLVSCAETPDDFNFPTGEEEDGTKTPTAEPSLGSALALSSVTRSSAGRESEATIISGGMDSLI
jgi:serine/threonine protein kinase